MTRDQHLQILRDDWQRSNDRIANLSRLLGRDHTEATVMIARELQTRERLKARILELTPQEQTDEDVLC